MITLDPFLLVASGSCRAEQVARHAKQDVRVYSTLVQTNTDELSLPVSAFFVGSVVMYK
jgi:hypothetical protein